ncbi:MAG TPA: TIGR00730 family Rossman fold protein, partial [Rudaea sp.]|nr:TIGR00730 family Rossman fold protein [Rudaea sp.]
MRICVYCASSQMCAAAYHAAATRLGEILAEAGCTIVYGGGAVGLMGSLANGALARGGKVIGIIPRFMTDVEWQHPGIENLEVVEDMR